MKTVECKPIVSVIIAAYNGEAYIKACLESVQKQSYSNWECIVVDDGSDDETFLTAMSLVKKDKRFKVFRQKHTGVSVARNYGLKVACGDYITFMDSDDRYDYLFLEKALQKIVKADLFIAGINNVQVDDTGAEIILDAWSIPELCFGNKESVAAYYIRNHKLLLYSNCNKLYRRDILKNNGITFDESLEFGEDRVFNYTYLQHADRVVTSEECYYYYYHRNNNSLSGKFRKQHIIELMELHQKKINWLSCVLNDSYVEELESYIQYDFAKEYNNAKNMLMKHRSFLSEQDFQEEEAVLAVFSKFIK